MVIRNISQNKIYDLMYLNLFEKAESSILFFSINEEALSLLKDLNNSDVICFEISESKILYSNEINFGSFIIDGELHLGVALGDFFGFVEVYND